MKSTTTFAYLLLFAVALGLGLAGWNESRAQGPAFMDEQEELKEKERELQVKQIEIMKEQQELQEKQRAKKEKQEKIVRSEAVIVTKPPSAVAISTGSSPFQRHVNWTHVPGGGPPIESVIQQAAEKLRNAEDDDARAAARQELSEELGKHFDEDMQRRKEELVKLEERLGKLKSQLQRRQEKRQEIIDLQVKVAENEADGLGFMSRPAPGSPGMSVPDPAPVYGGRRSSTRLDWHSGEASVVLPAPTRNAPPVPPVPPAVPATGVPNEPGR